MRYRKSRVEILFDRKKREMLKRHYYPRFGSLEKDLEIMFKPFTAPVVKGSWEELAKLFRVKK